MIIFETLQDFKLALLNSDIDRADLQLNRIQGTHNLSKASIIRRRWSSL